MFYPIAWLMGATSEDARQVARIVAVKTFINEFVAYDGKFFFKFTLIFYMKHIVLLLKGHI